MSLLCLMAMAVRMPGLLLWRASTAGERRSGVLQHVQPGTDQLGDLRTASAFCGTRDANKPLAWR
jgi:hypothetical protein